MQIHIIQIFNGWTMTIVGHMKNEKGEIINREPKTFFFQNLSLILDFMSSNINNTEAPTSPIIKPDFNSPTKTG